jgi:hypothetical protein
LCAARLLNFYLDHLLKGKAKIAEEEKNVQLEVGSSAPYTRFVILLSLAL